MSGLEVSPGTPDQAALSDTLDQLVTDRVASRISAQDPTLWGPEAEAEARVRMGWVTLASAARSIAAEVSGLREQLRSQGVDRIVLCGMGGSSLAPEVICAQAGVSLSIVDSSDPDYVRSHLTELDRTAVVVSSKSGGTVETDSQKRVFERAFTTAGIDPADRMVVVTDPGSPLAESATAAGYTVFLANPDVGGRYSAFTAFGLVPSGLAGTDLDALIDDLEAAEARLSRDSVDNPGLVLGALLGLATTVSGVDKLALCTEPGLGNFGDWAEQLIAESTGKQGTGILPVVVADEAGVSEAAAHHDVVLAHLSPGTAAKPVPTASGYAVAVRGALASQMLLWEYATAIASVLLGVDPFNQPDVESAKAAARDFLEGGAPEPEPAFVAGDFTVYAPGDWLPAGTDTIEDAVRALLDRVDADAGYLAVHAYADRHRDADLQDLRGELAARLNRPTTFGWGPRFLHSTGQYHKGGPTTGVFLQISTSPDEDLDVPGRTFTFQEFITAQIVGDGQVLAARGCPVLRLHAHSPDALGELRKLVAR